MNEGLIRFSFVFHFLRTFSNFFSIPFYYTYKTNFNQAVIPQSSVRNDSYLKKNTLLRFNWATYPIETSIIRLKVLISKLSPDFITRCVQLLLMNLMSF